MCDCGCNTCETKGPLLTEGKVKSLLSEGLQYHIDKKIPLFETVYRIGSDKHLALIREARKMYSRNVIDLCEDDEALIKTHLGEFALYEGESVPLDLPMLNEKGADTAWEDEEGNKITLQDILDMTKKVPQKDYPTEKLAKVVLNWDDNPEEVERIDQVEISKSLTGEQYKLLKENLEVTVSFMEEKPISVELPNNIECTIETTDAAIKNQTASSSYKPALLDCGIRIDVPPFIESGEKIIIDTRTLEYVKRVN